MCFGYLQCTAKKFERPSGDLIDGPSDIELIDGASERPVDQLRGQLGIRVTPFGERRPQRRGEITMVCRQRFPSSGITGPTPTQYGHPMRTGSRQLERHPHIRDNLILSCIALFDRAPNPITPFGEGIGHDPGQHLVTGSEVLVDTTPPQPGYRSHRSRRDGTRPTLEQ